jgi:hypothetical protein
MNQIDLQVQLSNSSITKEFALYWFPCCHITFFLPSYSRRKSVMENVSRVCFIENDHMIWNESMLPTSDTHQNIHSLQRQKWLAKKEAGWTRWTDKDYLLETRGGREGNVYLWWHILIAVNWESRWVCLAWCWTLAILRIFRGNIIGYRFIHQTIL